MLDASLTLDRLIIIILLIFIWHIHEIEDCTDICTAFFSLKKKRKKGKFTRINELQMEMRG